MYKMWSKLSLNWSIKIKNHTRFKFSQSSVPVFSTQWLFFNVYTTQWKSHSVLWHFYLCDALWISSSVPLNLKSERTKRWANVLARPKNFSLYCVPAHDRTSHSSGDFLLNVFRLVASECKTEFIVSHTVKDEFMMHTFMNIDKMTSTLLVPFLTCCAW